MIARFFPFLTARSASLAPTSAAAQLLLPAILLHQAVLYWKTLAKNF
jgi:hypothetical protein